MLALRALRFTLLASTLSSIVSAQTYPVAVTQVSWPNPSGQGSAVLAAAVHYPAADAFGTPLSVPGGLPVVVFLHGFGFIGSDYAALGDHLAREGYVTVLLDTAPFSYLLEELDARAMFHALARVNARPGNLFEGVFDMERVGLMGHSMGGAVLAYVLRDDPGQPWHNPGYRCGLTLAPVNPGLLANGIDIRVPVGIVSGEGDPLTPPAQHASPFYAEVDPDEGLKFHYAMDLACGHMNIVGLAPQAPTVFTRSKRIAASFFDQFLGEGWRGLEAALGSEGTNEPHLQQLDRATVVPQAWADRGLTVGHTTQITVASEPGFVGLAAASALGPPLPTPLGTVLLDPATSFVFAHAFVTSTPMQVALQVPSDPLLIGSTFAVQCAGATVNEPLLFGSAMSFVIEP